MKALLYLFVSLYCLIKNFLGISPGFIRKCPFAIGLLIQTCLFALTTIFLLPPIILGLISRTFLCGMDLWLIWKLGKNYGGRLKAQDAQLDSSKEKLSISVLIVLNHDGDQADLVNRLAEMAKNVHNSSYKFSCTIENLMGYSYYVKNQMTAEDCIVYTTVNDKEHLTREELLDYVQTNCVDNVINRKNLWFGRIFKQPIKWNKQSESKKQTAVMLVFRHCLGDGISLIGLLKNFMIREEQPQVMKLDPKYTTKPAITLDDAYFYRNPVTCRKDEPVFDLSNSKREVVFYIEDEIKYVPLVKKIKTKLGVGFTEVLIGCLTASMAEVLTRRGKTMDKCGMGVVFRPMNEDLVSIVNGTYNYNNLTNDSTFVVIDVPVTMKKGSTIIDRIKAITVEIEKAKYAVDSLGLYTAVNFNHLWPRPILEQLMIYFANVTAGVTNVGGLKEGTIAGCEVETALSFVAYMPKTCFRMSIFTKGDRFQLALAIRENVVCSRKEAQSVIDNIFKFVDHLSKELGIH